MQRRRWKIKLFTTVFVLIGLCSSIYYVYADIPCADPICIAMPVVSGDVSNNIYFNGEVDVSIDIEDYDAFAEGDRRDVYISYDGGTTWSDDPVPYSHNEFSTDMNEQVTSSSITVLDNNKVLVTWVEKDFDPPPPSSFNFILTGYRLYYRLYDFDGTPFTDAELIEYVDAPNSSRYANPITLSGVRLSNGQFGIIWNDFVSSTMYADGNINYRSYDLSGSIIVNKKKLNNNYGTFSPYHFEGEGSGQYFDDPWFQIKKLPANNDGTDFVIFYQGAKDEYGDPSIFVRLVTSAGIVINTIELTDLEPQDKAHVSIDALYGVNNGGFVIASNSMPYPDDGADINVSMYSSTGSQIGNTYQLSGGSTTGYYKPTVLGSQTGGFLMVYLSSKGVSTQTWMDNQRQVSLYHQRFTESALPLAATLIRSDPIYGNPDFPEDVHLFTLDYQPFANSIASGSTSNIFRLKPGFFRSDSGNIINYHTVHKESLLFGDYPYGGQHNPLLNSIVDIDELGVVTGNLGNVIIGGNYAQNVYKLGVLFNDIVALGGERYLAKTAGNAILSGKFIARSGGTLTYPGSYLDKGKVYFLSKNKKALFNGFNSDGLIQQDIAIQIKVVDKNGWNEYLSPIRNLIYVGNDGANGSISYQNGFINSADDTNVAITINNTCQSCDVLQLYQRTAPVQTGTCGAYSTWQTIGGTSTLDTAKTVSVDDGFCYQYKAEVSNADLAVSQEYTSTNQVIVDRVAPVINITSDTLSFDFLNLGLNFLDTGWGIVRLEYRLNDVSGFVIGPFAANSEIDTSYTATLDDGLNRVEIIAEDFAGNISTITRFFTADLAPPDITIIGIEEGGIYSSDSAIIYSFTQELSNVTITVNGVERSDLIGLPDGSYVLVITGTDVGGNTVSNTVNFTIDNSMFSFNLLSPQNNRTFAQGTVPIQYDSSKPLTSLKYSLNGAPEQTYTGVALTLGDGSYNIVVNVVSQDGDIGSSTVDFTVSRSLPALDVISPANNAVYPSNSVALNYASDSAVVTELDGNVIDASVVNLLLDNDGEHLLRISATHPVSSTVITEVISFFTDSVVPNVQILSPEPRIYTKVDIPVEFETNKTLNNITYFINDSPVSKLSNLAAGSYTFRMAAQDNANRTVLETVAFEVAELSISNPQDGDSVVSNVIPPVLDFQYEANGNFDLYSVAIDEAVPTVLTSEQGPGTIVPLPILPGDHDVTLRGTISAQQVGTRAAFKIGAKNIAVETGSIDYTYSNCASDFTDCDVQARLIIRNIGDFDVTEQIKIRFDHVDGVGYETFWFDTEGLEAGVKTELTVPEFKASLGDLLAITVDPFSELQNEWAVDNNYSIDFSAGQIVDIKTALPSTTKYLEGVSAFNLMNVSTAGPIDILQYRYGGWLFEQTSSNGEFSANMDMGLLTRLDSCIEITALSAVRVVLDSATHCFNITELDLPDLEKYRYTWESHEVAIKEVNIDQIDVKALLKQSALLRRNILGRDAAVLPELTANGELVYKVYYDPGAIAGRADNVVSTWSSQGFLGGFLGLPNGRSIVVTTLRPSQNVCSVNGATMIRDVERMFDLEVRYQEEIEKINATAFPAINEPSVKGLSIFFTNSTLFFNSISVVRIEDFFSKFNGISRVISDAREHSFGDILFSFFDLKLNTIGWVKGDIPNRAGEIRFSPINPKFVNRFVGRGCAVVNQTAQKIRFDIYGYFESGIENVELQLLTNSASVSVDALTYLSWGLPDVVPDLDLSNVSLSVPLFYTSAKLNIYAIDLRIPIDFGVKQGIIINDNSFDQFGPFHARFSLAVDYKKKLAKAEIEVYPLFFTPIIGLGVGADYKAVIDIEGVAKFDFIAASGFSDRLFNYVNYDGDLKLYKRKKYCAFGACYKRGWKVKKTLWSAPDASEDIPLGFEYTQEQVNSALIEAGANWPIQ